MRRLILAILLLMLTPVALASSEYGDGWEKECSDNSRCSYQNYHTVQKWDGKYIPYESLNLGTGQWTYSMSENSTHYDLVSLGETLSLPKSFANYEFSLTDISFSFTVTPAQLNSKSTANGSGQWYITIPDKTVKTRFIWDNKKPVVTNNTGDILDESNYWYSVVNDKRRLNYNQVARNFGIASSTVTFQFNSWTVGSNGSSWSGNSSFDNTTLTGDDDNNIVVGNEADWFNRANNTNLGSDWAEVGTASAINTSAMKPSSLSTQGVLFQTNFDVNKTILFTYYDYDDTHQDSIRLVTNSSASSFTGAVIRMDDTVNTFNLNGVAPTGGSGQKKIVHGNIIRIVINSTNIDGYIDSYYVGGWNYISDAGYVGFMNGFAGGTWGFDNFTVYNATTGNRTTWHDSDTGNETYQLDVNVSTPANTNYSVTTYNNDTGAELQSWNAQTGNTSFTLTTKVQDTKVNVTLYGNTTATPELMAITFWTQAVSGGATESGIPPDPINLTNTTGNYWVNHTWEVGVGNITNSYNLSLNNGTWVNGSANTYLNNTVGASGWQNITVWAWNNTGNGNLSLGNVTQNTQAPAASSKRNPSVDVAVVLGTGTAVAIYVVLRRRRGTGIYLPPIFPF